MTPLRAAWLGYLPAQAQAMFRASDALNSRRSLEEVRVLKDQAIQFLRVVVAQLSLTLHDLKTAKASKNPSEAFLRYTESLNEVATVDVDVDVDVDVEPGPDAGPDAGPKPDVSETDSILAAMEHRFQALNLVSDLAKRPDAIHSTHISRVTPLPEVPGLAPFSGCMRFVGTTPSNVAVAYDPLLGEFMGWPLGTNAGADPAALSGPPPCAIRLVALPSHEQCLSITTTLCGHLLVVSVPTGATWVWDLSAVGVSPHTDPRCVIPPTGVAPGTPLEPFTPVPLVVAIHGASSAASANETTFPASALPVSVVHDGGPVSGKLFQVVMPTRCADNLLASFEEFSTAATNCITTMQAIQAHVDACESHGADNEDALAPAEGGVTAVGSKKRGSRRDDSAAEATHASTDAGMTVAGNAHAACIRAMTEWETILSQNEMERGHLIRALPKQRVSAADAALKLPTFDAHWRREPMDPKPPVLVHAVAWNTDTEPRPGVAVALCSEGRNHGSYVMVALPQTATLQPATSVVKMDHGHAVGGLAYAGNGCLVASTSAGFTVWFLEGLLRAGAPHTHALQPLRRYFSTIPCIAPVVHTDAPAGAGAGTDSDMSSGPGAHTDVSGAASTPDQSKRYGSQLALLNASLGLGPTDKPDAKQRADLCARVKTSQITTMNAILGLVTRVREPEHRDADPGDSTKTLKLHEDTDASAAAAVDSATAPQAEMDEDHSDLARGISGNLSATATDTEAEAEAVAVAVPTGLCIPVCTPMPHGVFVAGIVEFLEAGVSVSAFRAWWGTPPAGPRPVAGTAALHIVACKNNLVFPMTIAPLGAAGPSDALATEVFHPAACFCVEAAAQVVAFPGTNVALVKHCTATSMVPIIMGATHRSGKPLWLGAHHLGPNIFVNASCAVSLPGTLFIPHTNPFGVATATLNFEPEQ